MSLFIVAADQKAAVTLDPRHGEHREQRQDIIHPPDREWRPCPQDDSPPPRPAELQTPGAAALGDSV